MGPLQREAWIEDIVLTRIVTGETFAAELSAAQGTEAELATLYLVEQQRHWGNLLHMDRPTEAVQRRMDELADDAADALRWGMP